MSSEKKQPNQSPKKNGSSDLSKIVYFDEGSATDLIQIYHGGGLNKTLELFEVDDEGEEAEGKAEGKVGLGKILQGIIGFGTSVEGGSSLTASHSSNQVAKNILTNTVLTDFIECVEAGESGVERLEEYEISTIDNAMSSMMLITPYLTMLRSGQGIRAGEFNVSLERIDDAIQKAKGYYEFLAEKDDSDPIILRFNHSSFKNNYKLSDLLKMRLVIYAVHVGSASPDSLDIEKELTFTSSDNGKNPSYTNSFSSYATSTCEITDAHKTNYCEMYDVILAGVKGNA